MPLPMPPRVGQVVNNKYRLLRHIGDGGMGSVFEARHETLGTTVALKFLHLEFSKRQGLVQRFLQEARASAQIQSINVVRVSDVDQTADGDVFIVLEYLEGKTLQALYEELYRAGRKLAYPDALDYATQIIDGVEAAHRAGIVHRDLKPDNVMITTDAKGAPLVKLLDFGIAKLKAIGGGAPGLTRPGVLMGTPEYMAPEQTFSADTVDARADVFSLGVMIFEMLAGQRPVGGEDPHEIAAAYRSGQISQLADLVPDIAPELAAAVHRAMAARAEDRFPTAADMRTAIEPFASAVRAPTPSRLRAGGTIGVSIAATAPVAAVLLPAPAGPPPPATARPGGVAKTWPPEGDQPPPTTGGGRLSGTMVDSVDSGSGVGSSNATAPMRPSGTMPGADRGSTQEMAQPYGYTPPLLPATPAARRRKRGTPVGVILAAALALTGVVTGTIYLATRSSSSDDDPPTKTKPSSDPLPPVSANPQQPPIDPPIDPPPMPMPPAKPPPRPPAPKPSGSTAPSSTAPPPLLVLPTSLPFPFPFQPAPQPSGSGPSKQKDPPPPLFPGL